MFGVHPFSSVNPIWKRISLFTGRSHPRLKYHSSTPVFSPAPRLTGNSSSRSESPKAAKTPTTAELYRYMSLATNGDERSGSVFSHFKMLLLTRTFASLYISEECSDLMQSSTSEHFKMLSASIVVLCLLILYKRYTLKFLNNLLYCT